MSVLAGRNPQQLHLTMSNKFNVMVRNDRARYQANRSRIKYILENFVHVFILIT